MVTSRAEFRRAIAVVYTAAVKRKPGNVCLSNTLAISRLLSIEILVCCLACPDSRVTILSIQAYGHGPQFY